MLKASLGGHSNELAAMIRQLRRGPKTGALHDLVAEYGTSQGARLRGAAVQRRLRQQHTLRTARRTLIMHAALVEGGGPLPPSSLAQHCSRHNAQNLSPAGGGGGLTQTIQNSSTLIPIPRIPTLSATL